jgi:purine-binding chemotaxis protein CheW
VLDIVSVDASQIQKVPRTGHGEQADFLSGLVTHDGVMIALIELSEILSVHSNADAATRRDAAG